MTPKWQKRPRFAQGPETLHVIHPHAAGIDVHSADHWVAVPAESVPASAPPQEPNLPPHVRRFGACTADLEMLADWLNVCGITTVAMESTGVYWIALFELLERRGFEVRLVNARQTRQVSGRPKSDVLDCQWIQRLHAYGLLSASFRPEDQVVVLRSYLRQRQMLLRYGATHIHHMQKALEQMNVKLPEVVTDIVGVTGLAIIRAILAGERNPLQLAKLRQLNCKRTEAEIARALYGNWREEHLFALAQALAFYEMYQEQVRACDVRIEQCLGKFADRSRGKHLGQKARARRLQGNDPRFDVRGRLFSITGVDLTLIEGIDESTALVILSEIGRDMSKWPSVKHFVSWLGLCPIKDESAGRDRRRRRRRNSNRAARALRLAAQGCHHAKNALGAFYRRIQARCGGPKAVGATARKIAERVYRLLRHGEDYVRLEMAAAEKAYQERTLKGLARRAAELGYTLLPKPDSAAATESLTR